MKTKLFQLMLAALVVCGLGVFTSCSNDDKDNNIDNLSEKIIGKWIKSEQNGQSLSTDRKTVFTFISATKAYVTASRNSRSDINPEWMDKTEADVTIVGNKVTMTFHPDKQITSVHEYTITAINGSEFSANEKITVTADGKVVISEDRPVRFTKVTTDYSADIIGTWEGHCTSQGSVFDDGKEHCWQYNADGTYVYYIKEGDDWVPYATSTLSEYFVDGNLLCTRWIDLGQENREWWEISINGNKMNWTALRQNPDGTTFTATFEMTKVE